MSDKHLRQSNYNQSTVLEVSPDDANWDYLSFQVISLKAGESFEHTAEGNEIALTPLQGAAHVSLDGNSYNISRTSVFSAPPRVLYAPPGSLLTVTTQTGFEYAIGGAPASGKYPVRLFEPHEMKQEVRGGGPATRQVNHILAHPLPAERLILFEVYVPGGAWSGYPPHCHDRFGGSAYLEETYYFRFSPDNGFGFHRNYRTDTDFDEKFVIHHGDLALVTQGFHSTTAAPGSNMYFLNYLAGELQDQDRSRPPFDDPQYAHLKDAWDEHTMRLPVFGS